MTKFVTQLHGGLYEAVADENGCFTHEGLDDSIEARTRDWLRERGLFDSQLDYDFKVSVCN